jgi:hypothetical protein
MHGLHFKGSCKNRKNVETIGIEKSLIFAQNTERK